ncbi:MAG TPA: hypothetical protein VFH62_09085 [Dehalococcoidia bacterium]|jgi:hypothetical protein|nr:hypothetical protein [Dehalococcoidia bacterium]
MADGQEQRLLREISDLADRIRVLRQDRAAANGSQISALNDDMRSKWDRLRRMRAPAAEPEAPRRGGHYQ